MLQTEDRGGLHAVAGHVGQQQQQQHPATTTLQKTPFAIQEAILRKRIYPKIKKKISSRRVHMYIIMTVKSIIKKILTLGNWTNFKNTCIFCNIRRI